jgi:glycosyltransferase involved in cell wall biosynthesis
MMLKHRAGRVESITPGRCAAPGSHGDIPRVTIGIPTFNRAASLVRAVESCRAQSYPNLEIVVSDNASDDDTHQRCARWAAEDDRIVVIHQPRNIGRERNFGAVLAAATGEYFMWLSDDDWLDADYVSACASRLRSDGAAVMAGGTIEYFCGDEPSVVEAGAILTDRNPAKRILSYLSTVELNGTYYSLMRRHAVCLSEFPATLTGDWYFVAQITAIGTVAHIPDVVLHRSAAGDSSNMGALAAHYGMSPRWGRDVHLWTLFLFVPALLRGRGTFRVMSSTERAMLAAKVSVVLLRRWWHHSGRQRVGIHFAGRVRRRVIG